MPINNLDLLQSQIIDVRVSEVVPASADGNIEFSGKIGPHWVSAGLRHWIETDEIVDGIAQRSRVHHFVLVDSGKRTSHHVSNAIEGGLEGCLVSGVEAIDNVWGVLELDATELNVGARCDVNDTNLAVLFDAVRIKSHLIRVHDSIGYLEAHHELAGRSLVAVKHTNIFHALYSFENGNDV
jgi:hypothetical protein